MNLGLRRMILTTTAMIIFALAAPAAFAQQDTPSKPTATGQMKESGKQVGKAGTSLGHDLKHGRIFAAVSASANIWPTRAGTSAEAQSTLSRRQSSHSQNGHLVDVFRARSRRTQ